VLNLALIGCGAVAEILYRPALQYISAKGMARLAAVVDTDLPRAKKYASPFKAETFHDLEEALVGGSLDAAIIAAPHLLHAPLSVRCLQAGLSVLCEKPMAITAEECDRMMNAARDSSNALVIGLFRRYFPSTQAIKQLISRQILGQVHGFEFLEGDRYIWPAKTASMFSRQLAGGGVLMDAGAHLLDLLLWWLGDVTGVDYFDDAMGGVEANCELKLRMQSGVSGRVRLSREYPLPNSYTVHCEQGDIIYHCDVVDRLSIRERATGKTVEVDLRSADDLRAYQLYPEQISASFDFLGCFFAQLENFCHIVEGSKEPIVSTEEARRGIELIQRCYQSKRFLKMPWLPEAEQKQAEALSANPYTDQTGKPEVAVVGAGGFIGYRLCEWLILNDYAAVTPVMHSAKSLALLARFDRQPVFADVLDQRSLEKAFAGKDIVFHTAVGDRRTIVRGIENTIRAARSAEVPRVVYMSTACVYGNTLSEETNEATPLLKQQSFAYNKAKVEAEEVINRMRQELAIDIVVIRPLIVWGPRSQSWVVDTVQSFKNGTAYLIDRGNGICNTAYIDNLVKALWLAATIPESKNQDFIVNDVDTVTWRDLYSGLKKELSMDGTPWQEISLNDAEAELTRIAHQEKVRQLRTLHIRLAGKVTPQSWKPAIVKALRLSSPGSEKAGNGVILNQEIVALQLGQGKLSNTKAQQILGYEPSVSFAEGMARTGKWLRFMEGRTEEVV
jgi:predicted dehydrogenase/nucleoside-diphosphate-sugar epimerase